MTLFLGQPNIYIFGTDRTGKYWSLIGRSVPGIYLSSEVRAADYLPTAIMTTLSRTAQGVTPGSPATLELLEDRGIRVGDVRCREKHMILKAV